MCARLRQLGGFASGGLDRMLVDGPRLYRGASRWLSMVLTLMLIFEFRKSIYVQFIKQYKRHNQDLLWACICMVALGRI